MFIELTDHLRCPAEHDETFLVLLPDAMNGRSVVAGRLGCPTCGRTFQVAEGEWNAGGAPREECSASVLNAQAIVTLAGLDGPGGYFVLVGHPSNLWRDVATLAPGVGLVAINPGPGIIDEPGVSILRGGRIPLKANSVRGVVLGPGYGDDVGWIREAARVTLPGLRVVGEGTTPPADVIDLMATAGGTWVGSKRR